MQRGKPALVSVFLSFVCIITVSSRFCSKDLFKSVDLLQKEAPNKESLNCSLYTPTIDDFKQNCPNTTMHCYAREMEVLIVEWEIRAAARLKRQLRQLLKRLNQTESACPQCEAMKEENATKFLQSFLDTLQSINSQCSKGH